MQDQPYSLRGMTLVTPDEVLVNASLTVHNGRIAELGGSTAGQTLDLRGQLVFPGLINTHDHLFGTWWPRVGPGRPYANVYDWLAEYEGSPVLYDRGQNSAEDMYEFGMYRNLVSGVTTVADHFKRIAGPEFYTRHPIHVLYAYGRTWLPRHPRRTGWGDDIPVEYSLAARTGQPYIIHLAEGVDEETAQEMDLLLEANALGRQTMIVHGISLRPDDMRRMAEAGASVCWCPGSNLYLYGQTANIPALLRAGVNVTLGTDSTLTGGLNVLDEVRAARRAFRDMVGQDPSSRWLVELMTTHASYALLLQDRRGRIAPGYEADLLVLPDGQPDPYSTLVEANVGDIALLICAGVPVYGDPDYYPLFEQSGAGFSPVFVDGREKLVAGDLLALLGRLSEAVGWTIEFPFLPCSAVPQKNDHS